MIKRILNLLILTQFWGYKKINGWLSQNEAVGLYKVSSLLPKNAVVVEIGSWQGKSTYCILSGLISGKVYAIDPFDATAGADLKNETEYMEKAKGIDLLEIFNDNLKKFISTGKIEPRKGYSNQFNNEFKEIDFLFIDGDHTIKGCTEDYDLYAHKIVKGGYIAFHDYYEEKLDLGPTHVINEVILKENIFTFFGRYDSLWVARKN
ncbi:class I SAM-dependent methyltransferase [Pedobacter sp. LMG 31464]|uniref:Class I SAM-dependent methyltransferase n=1 Tax=Pedobacter planticolens TaxID=2679964 RepID=A0A923DZR6_9SPHI|nr:class I SAM-dependent methyltransferase [Pedobacter planticolens]MBB2147109.1 class I SAM-dependent methyltransferase [Pedobacter planticolens]